MERIILSSPDKLRVGEPFHTSNDKPFVKMTPIQAEMLIWHDPDFTKLINAKKGEKKALLQQCMENVVNMFSISLCNYTPNIFNTFWRLM